MKDKNQIEDKSSWAIGRGVLLGVGIGSFFLTTSVFVFVGCILAGLGLGLIIAPIISSVKNTSNE